MTINTLILILIITLILLLLVRIQIISIRINRVLELIRLIIETKL